MASKNDILVFDEEYNYASKEIVAYCDELVHMIEIYSKSVNIVLEKAIKDEKISANLREIVTKVDSVKGEIKSIGKQAANICKNYISEIDTADDFLY